MRAQRVPSDSRCSQQSNAPYEWFDYVDSRHQSVVKYEQHFARMLSTLRAMVEGELEDLFEAAANGELEESADEYTPLKPIVADPEVWELRHSTPAEYRFYHAEPPNYPQHLLKLHRHIKDDAAAQQVEIDYAVSRYKPEM